MVYLKNILVTTDLSRHSLAAMEYAASFGLLYASKLFLLHIVDSEKDLSAGKKAMAEFVRQHLNPDLKLTRVLRSGPPAEQIKRFAEEVGVDLIVMATHGRTGFQHIVMGSVAEKVVRLSPVPVLTIKPRPLRESILRDEDVETELHLRQSHDG
jgi:nucleotide-binding universal stress UspA family protein